MVFSKLLGCVHSSSHGRSLNSNNLAVGTLICKSLFNFWVFEQSIVQDLEQQIAQVLWEEVLDCWTSCFHGGI